MKLKAGAKERVEPAVMGPLTVTFLDPLLGTVPQNPDLFSDYVWDGVSDDEQEAVPPEHPLEAAQEQIKMQTTGFYRRDGNIVLRDYQIKGFLKDAADALARVPGTVSSKLLARRKVMTGLVFPEPRWIPLMLPEGGEISHLERPGRGNTPRGETQYLARSETAPEGTTLSLSIRLLDPELEEWLVELLDYGQHRGLCQWRSAGYGRFRWEYA